MLLCNKFIGHALSSTIGLVMNVAQKFRVKNVHPSHLSHHWHSVIQQCLHIFGTCCVLRPVQGSLHVTTSLAHMTY